MVKNLLIIKRSLLPLLAALALPTVVSAEKMTEKEKTEWIEVNKQCPARMMSKSKTDRRMLAVYKMARENNIKNIDKNIIKPAFTTYCDCMTSIAFINIDKENMINYVKNTCVPLLQDEVRQRIQAETILNK